VLSHQDGRHSAVALLLKAALIQVSDYRLLGVSDLSILNMFQVVFQLSNWFQIRTFSCEFPIQSYVKLSAAVGAILVGGPKPPDIFLEENHPMTISSKICSY
jgi:hypothetical protein